MIERFFQRLDEAGVRYLLISGQATILYGAATFSEDVDIWLEPDGENLQRFMEALRRDRARYYKLTPALDTETLLRGHGFHFVIPGTENALDLYLDVMGQPPRVLDFADALTRAQHFQTDYGLIPTIGVKDLVEIKKTQRPADYPIIGRLALVHLAAPNTPDDDAELHWALNNVFGLAELRAVVAERPRAFATLARSLREPLAEALTRLSQYQDLQPKLEDELDAWLESRSSPLRTADRQYWRPIIEELRALKRGDRLMVEGALV